MIFLSSHNFSAREIIQHIFSPLIGVISSPLADDACHRNNLTFVELLQPFAKLPTDAQFRDVSGTSVSIRGLRLNFCDVDWRPPQTILARKMLNEAVTNASSDKIKFYNTDIGAVEVPTSEPWFEQWRETFLNVQFPADHEFTRHLLSCLIVLCSSDPNIVETAHKLTLRIHETQLTTPQKLPKWFHPNSVLNNYIVLHEGSTGDLSRAQQGYELLKSTFGDNKCFLIQINSLDETTLQHKVADHWAPYIKRQHRSSEVADQTASAPKTPQDMLPVMSMPLIQHLSLSDSSSLGGEPFVAHPLSPMQEQAAEAIHSKLSISNESIASHTINPNIWSGESELPDSAALPHGALLNAMDVENLRHFVQDYALRALIPYVEHLVGILSEAVTNKKGVSKSLLSATKRWFATSKPVAGASNQNAVIYTHESVELQTRKLADLYFMFCHYNLAFQSYHQAKRDFNADSAWQYYAGALEMAALSAFMLGTANRKTYDYMDDAIQCYLNVCKLQQFATRATLLSIECLKTARLYGEAAKQLTRMTSEDSDLRSALLLEQAAYCFLGSQPSAMHRKYAFHLIQAGNRYSRAGQRNHAYRCYQQAFAIFAQRNWYLAEDHIQYTLAKQAYMLKKFDESSRSIACLLRPHSAQTVQQQTSFLKEFIQTQNELMKRPNGAPHSLLSYGLPCLMQKDIRFLVGAPQSKGSISSALHTPAATINISSNMADEPVWQKMEEMLVSSAMAASNKAFVFKPSCCLFNEANMPTSNFPLAVQGEPIEVCVTLANTVRCAITLSGVNLLWQLHFDNDETLSNLCLYDVAGSDEPPLNRTTIEAAVKCTSEQALTLSEHEEQTIYFTLTPKLTGRLSVIGMVCQVAACVEPATTLLGTLNFAKSQGQQPPERQPACAPTMKVIASLPYLSVDFTHVPQNVLAGEILPINMLLRNMGIAPIAGIYLGCECPRWLTLNCGGDTQVPLAVQNTFGAGLAQAKLYKDKEIRRQHVCRLQNRSGNAPLSLQTQEACSVPLWLQAPHQSGECTLRLLFYYELPTATAAPETLKYRLVRHTWQFYVHKCMRGDIAGVISNGLRHDLSLNINVLNDMEPNSPFKGELYVNALALYSPQYRLNSSNCYVMNDMEVTRGQAGERCLQPGKALSYQCALQAVNSDDKTATATNDNIMQLLEQRLSTVELLPANCGPTEEQMPRLSAPYSFLMKNETNFFRTNIAVEDFNNSVTKRDPHATIVLSWMAAVSRQNALERTAFGQHFVQLRQLNEYVSCPRASQLSAAVSAADNTVSLDVLHRASAETATCKGDNNQSAECEEDYWESNDLQLGKRCLLEEHFVVPKV